MQQSDQTDVRRNGVDKLVRDIQHVRVRRRGTSSTTIQTAAVRTHNWSPQSMEGCNLLEHVHAGSVKVAATSESRAEWLVRTASYRSL